MIAKTRLFLALMPLLTPCSFLHAETWNWNGHLVIPFGGVNVYYIESDHKRYIGSMNTVACLGGYDLVIGVEPAVLAAWPNGPAKTDCSRLPAAAVVSSPPQIVYSTSDRASNTVNDVQRKSVTIPPGYNYLGVWYRETTANPRPSDGSWSVSHGRSGNTVWVETVARPNVTFSTGIWIGAEFRVQYTAASGVPESPPTPRPLPRPGSGNGGSTVTFFNGSGSLLYIFRALAPQNTTIDCNAQVTFVGTVDVEKNWAVTVPSGQVGLIRFQLIHDNGCEERNNKFTTTIVGLAQPHSETVNIQ
jgi:hypothetical protein